MEIISRKAWGARSPNGTVNTTTWVKRKGFQTHWSGTDVEPSIKSIQDYHMNVRGWSDIGYNFLIRNSTGEIFEGRGWSAVGAHCAGHNTENIGVCIMQDDDVPLTAAAKRSLHWLADQADERKRAHGGGGTLNRKLVHRDQGETDCPGDAITAWVHAGMKLDGPPPTTPPTPGPTFTEKIMQQLPTMRIGDGNGKAVKTVQAIINRDGGHLLEDGVWRERTDAAVRAWQAEHRVPDSVTAAGHGDGIFGPACWTYALDM